MISLPYHLLPEAYREETEAWVEKGTAPLDLLLLGIITDRLITVLCSPHVEGQQTQEIVRWFYHYAPLWSWGNSQALDVWPSLLTTRKKNRVIYLSERKKS